MSEWISKEERKQFEAWKDGSRFEAAAATEDQILSLTRLRLNSADIEVRAAATRCINELEDLHRILRGKEKKADS